MTIQAHKYLDDKGIPYEAKQFPETTEKGAANVAKALGFTERQAIKTLIFRDNKSGELVLVMVGGDQLAQSKNLKKAIGSKDVTMASDEEVIESTGYKIGSIPPFGWQKEGFRSFLESSLMSEEILGVGTGYWGNEIMITPENLKKAVPNLQVVNLLDKEREIFPEVELEKIPELSSEYDIANEELLPESEKVAISEVSEFEGKEISIEAWMYNRRSSGKISFLQIRDGSGFMQATIEEGSLSEEIWETSQSLTLESSARFTGTIQKHPRNEGEFEMLISDIKVIQIAPEYPIGKKDHGVEFLFKNRDLYLRSKTPWAVLRIRDQVMRSVSDFFFEEGFVRGDTPIFQPTSAEDTTELFELDYFGNPMYLTQSGQLYSEAGIMGFGKVYDFGPVFRAEKSKTRNHLTEFWMMDAEMAFYDQDMNEDLQERMVKRILSDALKNMTKELEILERDTAILEACATEPFKRMKHYEAKKYLETEGGFDVDYEEDMTTEEEIWLGNHFNLPIFIEDYPFEVKAFYMKSYEDERGLKRAKCADLIAPEEAREIIGGSQREDDYNTLRNELVARNYPLSDYEWYLNVRKYGSVPHSGFGLGLERMVKWISGVHHIRETIPFPRTLVLDRP